MSAKILLIEDNEQNRYLATFLLERRGHKVAYAADGPRGERVAHAHGHPPVAARLAVGNLRGRVPHAPLEGRAARGQRNGEAAGGSGEVGAELFHRGAQVRMLRIAGRKPR